MKTLLLILLPLLGMGQSVQIKITPPDFQYHSYYRVTYRVDSSYGWKSLMECDCGNDSYPPQMINELFFTNQSDAVKWANAHKSLKAIQSYIKGELEKLDKCGKAWKQKHGNVKEIIISYNEKTNHPSFSPNSLSLVHSLSCYLRLFFLESK